MITRLLNHLTFDDEMFWISAVLGGDARLIADLHDGWSHEHMTGAEAVEHYRQHIARSDEVLAGSTSTRPRAGGRRQRSSAATDVRRT